MLLVLVVLAAILWYSGVFGGAFVAAKKWKVGDMVTFSDGMRSMEGVVTGGPKYNGNRVEYSVRDTKTSREYNNIRSDAMQSSNTEAPVSKPMLPPAVVEAAVAAVPTASPVQKEMVRYLTEGALVKMPSKYGDKLGVLEADCNSKGSCIARFGPKYEPSVPYDQLVLSQ